MNVTTLVTASAIVAAPMAARADMPTAETLLDRAQIIHIADSIDAAVDAKDWGAARSYFAETITVDFSSLVGGAPATIPADALIDGWAGNLTAEKTSLHLRTNHRVAFSDPDTATLVSHGYAWNRMERGALPENGGEALWEVWGTYTHAFARTETGWTVTAMTFTATAERGNAFVRNTPGS